MDETNPNISENREEPTGAAPPGPTAPGADAPDPGSEPADHPAQRPVPAPPATPPIAPTESPRYHQPAYQRPAYEQSTYQQPGHQQPGHQQPGHQQPAHQQPGAASTPAGGWSSPGAEGVSADPWATRPLPTTSYGAGPAAPGGSATSAADDDTARTTRLPSAFTQTGHDAGGSGGFAPPPGHAGAPGAAHHAPAPSDRPTGNRRGRSWLAALAIGAILGGGAGAATVTFLDDDNDAASSSSSSSLDQDESSNGSTNETSNNPVLSDVGEVAEKVLPSVVSIQVAGPGGASGGSGVVLSEDGQILTNNHVVEGAGDGGQLTVAFQDGTTADAEVLGTDPTTDLAVIQAADVSGLTPATLGSSGDVTVGQQVVAIGSPLGLDGTVTTGIVSALDRPVQAGSAQGGPNQQSTIDAIQTDAPINPGNSGGPLVNMAGEVVGINSAIATTGSAAGSIGLGFSIPVDQAKPIAQELIDNGQATHARIGVGVSNPQDGSRGALVASVDPDSAAAEAGLQEGDIVTKVDDRVISDGTALVAAARSYRPGDDITLTVLRDGEEITVDLTLGSDAETEST